MMLPRVKEANIKFITELKKEYLKQKELGNEEFVFEGISFVTQYAKYLIEAKELELGIKNEDS